MIAKKSTFRPGSWEIIKKNGCPLCSKANIDSDRDEVGQDLDKDTKRKMDSLIRVVETLFETRLEATLQHQSNMLLTQFQRYYV